MNHNGELDSNYIKWYHAHMGRTKKTRHTRGVGGEGLIYDIVGSSHEVSKGTQASGQVEKLEDIMAADLAGIDWAGFERAAEAQSNKK